MNMSDYEQYYQKGGTYVLPIELFNELFGEMESWKEQSNQLQSNWNSLREWLEKQKEDSKICKEWNKNNFLDDIYYDRDIKRFDFVLDKMNELEGKDK